MFDYAVIEREFLSVFTVIVAKFIQLATPSADRLRPIRERQASVRAELAELGERASYVRRQLETAAKAGGRHTKQVDAALSLFEFDDRRAALAAELGQLEADLAQALASIPTTEVLASARNHRPTAEYDRWRAI
jgi:hypothetical protein